MRRQISVFTRKEKREKRNKSPLAPNYIQASSNIQPPSHYHSITPKMLTLNNQKFII